MKMLFEALYKMKTLLLILFAVIIVGCANFSQVSVVEEGCFPDGTCTVVGSYMNGAVIGGKQITVVSVKDCVKGADEKWTCTVGQKTISIDDGMAEKMIRATIGITKHTGEPYYEGDNINSGSASGSASGSTSSAGAAAAAAASSSGNGGRRGGRGGH